MDTKERLHSEHAEWTIKYVQAHEQVSALIKRCWEVREGENLPVWILTGESLTELDRAIENEAIALDKVREISHKLQEISQNER